MTRDEAVKFLKGRYLMSYNARVNEAVQLLCTQQGPAKLDRSRWEGCDYCNDPHPARDCILPDGTEQFLCSRDGLFGDCYVNTRKINFCPMCGRPLTEEAWAELERRINDGAADD